MPTPDTESSLPIEIVVRKDSWDALVERVQERTSERDAARSETASLREALSIIDDYLGHVEAGDAGTRPGDMQQRIRHVLREARA